MKGQFLQHINQYISLDKNDFLEVLSYFDVLDLPKKTLILEEGQVCRFNYFVLKGCLNMYFTDEKGSKRTVQFALENWWITDYLAFQNKAVTDFSIQTIEDCQILAITQENQNSVLSQFPQLEKYFRAVYQTAYGASLKRMKFLYDFSKEEMYFHFITEFPAFAQRIPQYLIASFLGLTPEYVSEIRKKKRS